MPICQTIRPRPSRQDVWPDHKPYPIMTQKSKLVTPAVVFNILNAELSSLATSFAPQSQCGRARLWWRTLAICLWRVSKRLPSCMSKTRSHTVPNAIFDLRPAEPERPVEPERIPIAEPAQKLERIPTPVEPEKIPISPVELEIPAYPEKPPMEEGDSTSDPRCDKGTQTLSPSFHVQRLDLGKRRMEPPFGP
ncbi:hypothetical protein TNCV_2773331 [Trichonephila clavipes]|nr:hypothetical protein TNCV_2773331 [Trichonephila clavipes]